MYFQFLFGFDRVKALAPQPPEWKTKELFVSLLNGDLKIVKDCLATVKHPVTKRPYTEMVYEPMVELLAYLRVNGFKTFIVSGGGGDLMRVFS